jgi:hypothetical protein
MVAYSTGRAGQVHLTAGFPPPPLRLLHHQYSAAPAAGPAGGTTGAVVASSARFCVRNHNGFHGKNGRTTPEPPPRGVRATLAPATKDGANMLDPHD